jgi:type IV pilus assembly protein PilB
MLFLEELVKRGIIKEEQISLIIKLADQKYKGSIDEALLEFNLDENRILDIKGEIFNVPVQKIDGSSVLSSTLKLIPLETAEIYHFVPIGIKEEVLEIGIVDPENTQAIDVLTFITSKMNKSFKLYLITISTYKALLKMYSGLENEVNQALSELDSEIASADKDLVGKKNKGTSDSKEEEKISEDAPIIKIVAVILSNATEGGASDIHIENIGDKIKVRFRVDGVLYTSLTLPVSVFNGVIARIKILAKLRLDEKRKPQDGGFSAKIAGRKIDFRVSTMPSYYGEKVVMRILDSQRGVRPLNGLDMSPENIDLVRRALDKPYGLILITGPTGSGKTTTLYSMISELDREKENIVSLEDPIEYQIPGINQSQVSPEIGYTFASGLRSILRQDPDIIMVGEIRDKETAELAIQAALTGHLVFSTLHTNSSVGAIPRLIDMGIDPYLISPTLVLCMAQRLALRLYEPSKKKVPMDQATRLMLEKQFQDLPSEFKSKIEFGDSLYEAAPAVGCQSGTKGRIPIYEIFEVDKEMQSLILKRPSEQDIYNLVRSRGMLSIREDAILKSLNGNIPFKEIYNF